MKEKRTSSIVIDPTKEKRIIVFSLGNEYYGIEINQVKEIAQFTDYTIIPNAPEYVLGLLDLRGNIIILLDLEKKFGLKQKENAERKHIIVCEAIGGKIGVTVDHVKEIISIKKEELQEPEELIKKQIKQEYLSGVVIYNERILIVLNIEKVLKEAEIKELTPQKEIEAKKNN